MASISNSISNLSYTNKDFNSIYNEILDLADSLSPKWSPSSSNESDPGVLLLKLDAILADKAHYNIDKNILELFPESVTQYANAREIFEQCGYVMKYYRAAELDVIMNIHSYPEAMLQDDELIRDYENTLLSFPLFTQLTDADNTIVFTLDPYEVNECVLNTNKASRTMHALQGICMQYTLNNTSQITYDSLDYNNRLYFKELNVAENGIFIQSYVNGEVINDITEWQQVDNLMVQPLGQKCYKFGVSREGDKCYIEFPTDIASIIGEGLNIHYLLTEGAAGNIASQVITSFVNDTESLTATDGEIYEFTSDHIYIRNLKTAWNGYDPETISEARKNYEKVKNTFNTLVSLHDYENYIQKLDIISNAIVCDRTNDIQCTTKIIAYEDGIEIPVYQISKTDNIDDLSAFDLKVYALQAPKSEMNTLSAFDITFEPITSDIYNYLFSTDDIDFQDIKSIQHDFIFPRDPRILNNDKYKDILAISLEYPINAKIIPYTRIDTLQQLEIQALIIDALIKKLNSAEITFGQAIEYDTIYDIIANADSRIKAVILQDITYTPYVIYRTEDGAVNKVKLADATVFQNYIKAKAILSGVTPLYDRADSFIRTVAREELLPDDSPDKGVARINSEVKFTISDKTSVRIDLLENENLYLTSPNYITKETYSNYCKYFTNINQNIIAQNPYKLTGDDYIIFCWKDSSTASLYKYAKYIEGTIIRFNFDYIYNEDYTEFPEEVPSLAGLGQLNAAASAAVAGMDQTILSNANAVEIVGLNELEFDSSYKLYWILNQTHYDENSQVLQYKLFEQGESTYILKAGEYLFYTDDTANAFAMLGAGTQITRTDSSSIMSVTARSYEQILYGKNNLLTDEELWYSIPVNSGSLTATEMQFYSLGQNSGLGLNMAEGVINDLIISNTECDLDFDGLEITLYETLSDSTGTILPNLDGVANSWKIYSQLVINCGYDKPQKFVYSADDDYTREQALTVTHYYDSEYASYSNNSVYAPTATNPIIYIQSEYDIVNVSGTEVDVLYVDQLDSISNNKLYMYVQASTDSISEDSNNIITVSTKPSAISSDLILIDTATCFYTYSQNKLQVTVDDTSYYLSVGNDNILQFTSDEADANTWFFYATSDTPLQSAIDELDASSEYFLITRDSEETPYYCTVDSDTLDVIVTNDREAAKIIKVSDSTIAQHTLMIDSKYIGYTKINSLSDTIQFKLNPGNYLLPIITYMDYSSCTFSLSNNDSIELDLINNLELTAKGAHYYEIDTDASVTLDLNIEATFSNDSATTSVSFLPIIKLANKLTDAVDADLLSSIRELDISKKFNYAHIIDPELEISDPLLPASFLNANHPYNLCTICKWDHANTETSIMLVNKVK